MPTVTETLDIIDKRFPHLRKDLGWTFDTEPFADVALVDDYIIALYRLTNGAFIVSMYDPDPKCDFRAADIIRVPFAAAMEEKARDTFRKLVAGAVDHP